jgi:cell division protein ZapA
MSDVQQLTVDILGRPYRLACEPGEETSLKASALALDARLRKLKASAPNATLDRVAVITALNLTHELLSLQNHTEALEAQNAQTLDNDSIMAMANQIDSAIKAGKNALEDA